MLLTAIDVAGCIRTVFCRYRLLTKPATAHPATAQPATAQPATAQSAVRLTFDTDTKTTIEWTIVPIRNRKSITLDSIAVLQFLR